MPGHQHGDDHDHGDGHDHGHGPLGHGHGDDHGHGHGDDHGHGPLESYDHVRGGAPVLDIGGDVGALVATVDDALVGTELHLRAARGAPVHTGVWARDHGAGKVAAAVFAELVEGTYWVLDDGGRDVAEVRITGGELSTLDLRS